MIFGEGSNASSSSVINNDLSSLRLSGNVVISSGSKYIHCPPPDAKESTGLRFLLY